MSDIYYAKIQGKVNIPEPLAIGHNFTLKADCSIVSEQKSDLEDGTYSVTYKLVPITAEITKDNGETIKAKDTRRVSQKIRNMAWKEWDSLPPNATEDYHDFEEIYEAVGYVILSQMPTLIRQAIKRIETK